MDPDELRQILDIFSDEFEASIADKIEWIEGEFVDHKALLLAYFNGYTDAAFAIFPADMRDELERILDESLREARARQLVRNGDDLLRLDVPEGTPND